MKLLLTLIAIVIMEVVAAQNLCIQRRDTFPAKLMVQDIDQDKPIVTLGYKIMTYKDCSVTGKHTYELVLLLDRKKKPFRKNIIAVETK